MTKLVVVARQVSTSLESDGAAKINGSYPELVVSCQGYTYDKIRIRRDRFQIYVEIIKRLSASPLNLTEVSLLTGLNFGMAKTHLDYLLSVGLVKPEAEERVRYSTTPKGRLFLEASQKALSYLNEQGAKQRTT